MLQKLTISNYALITKTVIDFKKEFTVITGETGSGKSLMLNALTTLVGGKVKYSSFTNADKKTIIEGQFILNDSYKSYFDEINGIVKLEGAACFAEPLIEIRTKTRIVAR